jgi:hypothetical protein
MATITVVIVKPTRYQRLLRWYRRRGIKTADQWYAAGCP